MSSRIHFAWAVSLLATVARAGDEPLFPRPVVVGQAPWKIGTVTPLDADGDGLSDVVVSCLDDGSLPPGLALIPADGPVLSFGASIPMTLGVHPDGPVAGDFDGDGDEDVFAPAGFALQLVRSNGDGSFAPPLAVAVSQVADAAVAGDADGDGDLDVLVRSNGVFVVRNDGGGAFASGPLTLPTTSATALNAGDVDGDGVLDAVIGKFQKLTVGRGLGGLSYTPTANITAPQGVVSLALGQLDPDGWLDIAWCSTSITDSRICHGSGGGNFAAPTVIPGPPGPGLEQVAIADLDGDGDSDLALRSGTSIERFVYVAYAGGGLVAIPPAGVLELESDLKDFALTDVDADGLCDIVAGDGTDLLVVRGTGAAGFAQGALSTGVPDLYGSSLHVTADFAADGCEDILYGGQGDPIRVLRGAPGGFGAVVTSPDPIQSGTWAMLAAGDFDGDGHVDAVGASSQAGTAHDGLLVVHGPGDGTLVPGPASNFVGNMLSTAVASDLDLDGDLDLCASRELQFVECLNDGAGVFTPLTSAISGPLGSIDVGDVDGNGLPDAISSVIFPFPGGVDLRLNLGGGVFAPKQYFAGVTNGSRLADVDADGRADLVQGRLQTGGIDDIVVLRWLPGGGFGPLTSLKSGFVIGSTPVIGGVADITGDGLADIQAFSHGRLAVAVADALHPLHAAGVYLTWIGDSTTLDFNGDGAPDVLTLVSGIAGWAYFAPCAPSETVGFWTNLGYALAGSAGLPTLAGTGTLEGGTQVAVDLAGARPAAPAVIFAGGDPVMLAWKGGTLVPSPDAYAFFATDAGGAMHLQMTWPSGLPPALDIFLQVWIQDAAGPKGFAASNALRALTP